MFDYETAAGQVYMKDWDNRLKSYKWTDKGIKLTIPDIDNKKDSGKYKGDVTIGNTNKEKSIEVKEIFGQ